MPDREPDTTEYRRAGHSTAGPRAEAATATYHPPVAVGPAADRTVRDLLHRRLRAACGLTGIMVVVPLLAMAATGSSDPMLRAMAAPSGLLVAGGVFAATAAVAAFLWARADVPLPALRRLEVLAFLAMAGYAVHFRYVGLTSPPASGEDPALAMKLSTAISIIVENLLLAYYGVFIPNTWRRCLALCGVYVGGLAAATLAAAASSPAVAAELPFVLCISAMHWTGSSFLCVYGSFRISTLQKQVSDARRVGQYTLRRRLGDGGMGEVYYAEHAHLRRPAAVKLIRPERVGDPNVLRRFEREGQATATLTHPNTVQLYDFGLTDDGTFYYVMEYLPGLTLDELVNAAGPLPPGRAVHLLRQVCGALREAHAIGLVHRDLKPSNVMVCERGGLPDVAKLLDFGLVLPPEGDGDAGRLTRDGAITGTPAYMSPEQADPQGPPDARTDGYSLGAVGYFLLTGRPPFAARSALQMLFAHANQPPAPPSAVRPEVPPDLDAVILRCLSKAPADRYPDAAALEAALAACGCAGEWTAADAAGWWRDHAVRPQPDRQTVAS